MKRGLPLLFSVLALGLLAAPAKADIDDQLGFDLASAGLGGAVGASGRGFAGVAYNPATLIGPEDPSGFGELSVSFVAVLPDLFLEGLEEGEEAPAAQPASEVYGLILGGRFDLGRAFGLEGLALAFGAYAPTDGLVLSTIRPDTELQWLMLGERMTHIALHAAIAYRITDWLSAGIGVRVTFDEEVYLDGIATETRTVTDPTTGEERVEVSTRLGTRSTIYGRAAPTLGVRVGPFYGLRFGFAWRGQLYSDDQGESRLAGIPGVGEIGFTHHFTHGYRPHDLSWSAAYRPMPELEISAELTWALWSEALSPNFDRLQGRFGDTLTPSVGVRATPLPGVMLMVGYRYVRAPFNNFGGPTNLLLSDRHVPSAAVSIDLDPFTPDEEIPVRLGLAFRLGILEDREEVKNGRRFRDDRALVSNPGYPGYRYGGLVPSLMLNVEGRW